MDTEAGRLLRRFSDHPAGCDYLVPENLRRREVLHLSPRHRIVVQTLRGHLHDPDLLSRTGKLPVALYGCVERRGAGPAAGADRFGQDTPLAHDLPAALLGDDGNDFTLDINNPEDPKILCVGNNPDRQNIYSAALGLYNSRIVRLINKKGKLKSSIIIDELPTIYFRGLDNLIATARSNKVAVCLSFQDFSQLERDYGQEEAKVIENTVGNIFAGQVLGDTAKTLSERFGRIVQLRTSNSLSNDNLTTSTNTQLDSLIPASKISNLSQGMFVGAVADNFDERIEQKIFHAEIVIDREKLAGETASYVPIPEISSFRDADGVDRMEEIIRRNYTQIKEDVTQIIKRELRRIAEDPALRHLLAKK